MDLFLYKSKEYKAFLKAKISENNKIRGYQSRLASAAGCQKSFISQVLKSHVHLTLDHGARLCRFWKLDEAETDFFLTLIEHARAGSPELRGLLENKMRKARQQAEAVSGRFQKATKGSPQNMGEYYSTWYMAAIHVLLSVPGFETAKSISNRLQISVEIVKESLQKLKQMDLIAETESGWKVTKSDLFLPKGSNLTKAYHTAWRHKAITALLQNFTPPEPPGFKC